MLSKRMYIFTGLMIIFILLLVMNLTNKDPSSPKQDSKQENVDRVRKDIKIIGNISTDKASYHYNEPVKFTTQLANNYSRGMLSITYYHLNKVISKQDVKVTGNEVQWEWQPPKEDFKGYLVHVKFESGLKQDKGTIAVDVSSDWSKFPRYGFLSNFQQLPKEKMQSVISQLNRYHINGLQFYDWHYKHHQPLKIKSNSSASHWEDIANRSISLNTIREYIDLAQERNMKTMAYNLLYGAFAEAEKDGVKTDWRLFKDQQGNAHDYHPLPDEWKSDVFLVNSGHPEWQKYIIDQQKKVYDALPFDGWHIDQLGPRGDVYDYNGNPVELDETFQPFIEHVKNETKDKSLVMNAVNQYGQIQIGKSPVDFLYTEVWDQYKYYSDLKRIIDENDQYSQGRLHTVLAAYMNYEFSNQPGEFNTAGILLANSVIFASGGSHLELGEHMLSKEYFPHENLKMDKSLEDRLMDYYDFLVAYENLLRDNVQEVPVTVQTSDWANFSAQPELGKIWSFAKGKDNKKILHLINFLDAETLEWRDTNAKQAEPKNREELTIQLEEKRPIKEVWVASPDNQNSIPKPLDFTQDNSDVTFTLPSLKYWNMVVIEYE